MSNRELTGIILILAVSPVFFLSVMGAPNGYTSADTCAGCHRQIWDSFQQTGMGRSFSRPSAKNTMEDDSSNATYYHKASDSYFTMLRRDGKYYQRRHQLDPDGKPVNIMEKQIDFIMGSGNHSRAYLHRTAGNRLIELPLAWYAERGGYWAMNPGYDRPDHDGFRRQITYDCMFCHNGYPQIPAANDHAFADPVYAGALPEGIDCQRCHGPGLRHAQLAKTAGSAPEAVRNAIVNPARLSPQRQMEVCGQCHLESTSFPLPNALQRYERGPFSYNPAEPLGDFILNFDHAPDKGRNDKFEIVSAVYRLRRSACFLKSNGKMGCSTCHNPHDIPRGEAAVRHYTEACRKCHASSLDQKIAAGQHTRAAACIDCHMPKRRTEDVVHVTATDHYIQRRRPDGDLLAEMKERQETGANAYRGEVVLYYPEKLAKTGENELYLAIAQVKQRSNLSAGIPRLTAAIERYRPARAEYYLELAEALQNDGHLAKSLPYYRDAVRHNPKFALALQKLGSALKRSGAYREAEDSLKRALAVAPDNATTWHELGLTYWKQTKTADAVAALQKAIELDPDLSEAHNNLGIIWFASGNQAGAESAFREAIRIQPAYADAHGNLGNLLSAKDSLGEARYHFDIALRMLPDDAGTRYNYAIMLGRTRDFDGAQRELEASLHSDPQMVDAHLTLGDLLMAKGQTQAAILHYREAARISPESGRAHLALASAMVAAGDVAGAIPHLQKAAADSDVEVRSQASEALRSLGK